MLPKLTVSTIENRCLVTPASYYRPKITRPRRRRPRHEIESTERSGIFLGPNLTTQKRLVWCPGQASKISTEKRYILSQCIFLTFFCRRHDEQNLGQIAVRKTLQEFKAAGLISPGPSSGMYEKLHKSSIRWVKFYLITYKFMIFIQARLWSD